MSICSPLRLSVLAGLSLGLAAASWYAAGCRKPADTLQVVLERHRKAVARMPEEERSRLMPYDAPLASEQTEDLLPEQVLDLETARTIAIRVNPDVHAAQARLEAAAAQIAEARARYSPTIMFTHTSTRTFLTPASRNRLATLLQPAQVLPTELNPNEFAVTTLLNAIRRPLLGGDQPRGISSAFSEHSSALTASWIIFDGFAREAQVLAAKAAREASWASLQDVERLIIQAVDAAYYQVQLAEEQIRIARADEAFSLDQLNVTEILEEAGQATDVDVDNFRVRMLAAQANVTAAIGLRETGRVVLAELMGAITATLPADLELSPLRDETGEDMTLPDVEPWLERALANRPDLHQLEHLLDGEGEQVRSVEALFWPTFALSGSWGFDRISNLRYTDDDQSAAAVLEFRWELYTGGARQARLRQAESARAEAAANLNRRRLAIQSEVRRAIIDLQNAQEQIRLQRENVKTAGENRRIVQAGYRGGKETLNRLNEAQRDYITAEADLALARIRLRVAWSDLHAAAGTYRETVNADSTAPPAD